VRVRYDTRVEGIQKQFTSTEEEIAFLREQIALRERDLLSRQKEIDQADIETVGKQALREYSSFTPESVLHKDQRLDSHSLASAVGQVEIAHHKSDEVMKVAQTEGIRNALSVLERLNDAFLTDEVHRQLIEYIKSGKTVQDLKDGVPPWQILHMTLFEITLPEIGQPEVRTRSVKELISVMQQFYSGMQSVGAKNSGGHVALEIAVSDKSDDIVFYVAVPMIHVDLFEKQLFSLFPHASLTERIHDYNIFVEGGTSISSVALLQKHPIYPLRLADSFDADPLDVLLNAFSKIERDGGGAALQILFRKPHTDYLHTYRDVLKKVRDGMKVGDAISRSTITGEVFATAKEIFSQKKDKREDTYGQNAVDSEAVEVFEQKLASPLLETNIRLTVSAKEAHRAEQILSEIEATFHQFENTRGNRFKFNRFTNNSLKRELKAFSFREFINSDSIVLSLEELALLMHFPSNGIESTPAFKQLRAKTAPAPNDMPHSGTLLGINDHRGNNKEIYITEKDRMRHFYIIGQTGTGKSNFLKNLIIQDIEQGNGVCMIDPHGTDIQDVLGAVPPNREKDVIYFDPSHTSEVIGLNMLEYDINRPEQKTFVVNELFSIFQRLYGANPESMGPMFEQYFRNATLLVMEDPDSGNTLMDISRVMSDSSYRKMKLEKAKNPVVVQFWREIATKAGGEASLENIVPYIVSKFDVFTANDYMRPIIGQQKSAFNFRQVMDERKILLVNLSKGRLGEINANLIGMIIVGKILMAALSRVDDPSMNFAPFFLHIDEFQNVTTDSISSILSEARKYKLGLAVAHQFIAQLDPKIRDSVFGNVGSVAAFRVGTEDAEFLQKQFAPVFEASDLMNIPNYHAYLRVLANGSPTKPFSVQMMPPKNVERDNVDRLLKTSYDRYARPKTEVEEEIRLRYEKPRIGNS
jgi:hypothetical protein